MGKRSAHKTKRFSRRLDVPRGESRSASQPVESSPRLRVHAERRRRLFKRTLAALVLGFVALVLSGGAWAYYQIHEAGKTMNLQPGIDESLTQVLEKRKRSEPFNVLLLGSDQRPWEDEDARADTIILARVDTEAKRVWLLSIPRDTRVEIPGYGVSKINAATFHGGPSLMVETVRDFLGVPINHYVSIDFTGFQHAVDGVGGVWIDVDHEIDDWRAASHSPGYRAKEISAGYQLLDGEHALTFVRTRDYPDADFSRMQNQQKFFLALAEQMTKPGNVLKIPSVIRGMAEYMSTDMRLGDMIGFADAMNDVGSQSIETATLLGEWKSPYVWTDTEHKEFLIASMMAGRSFDDTSVAEPEVVEPGSISIAVRNGAGIDGCASATAEILAEAGYAVGEVGNANQFVYDETLVVFKSGQHIAEQVARDLPTARVVESRGMYQFATDILVVVGKDFETWTDIAEVR